MRFRFWPGMLLALLLSSNLRAADDRGSPANAAVLRTLEAFPEGGGYSVRDDAFVALERGLARVLAGEAPGRESCPSFCSAGTWLLLLEIWRQQGVDLAALADRGIDPLLADGSRRRDGDGLWGRWNANGPGAAVLLHETGLGQSFTDPELARAGDLVKFWWTEAVGGRERGHLAVFLGWRGKGAQRRVRFWSATEARAGDGFEGGYAVREVAWTEVRHALFSRLLLPADPAETLRRLRALRGHDRWLASLLREDVSWEEVLRRSGVE